MDLNKIHYLTKHLFLCKTAWGRLSKKHVLGRWYMNFAKANSKFVEVGTRSPYPIQYLNTESLKAISSVPCLQARAFSTTACIFKSKNHSSDQDSLQEEEGEIDEAEIDELFQQQIPTGICEEDHHRIFIVHPDVKWGSKKQYLTTAALQMDEAVGLVNTLQNWTVIDKIILSTKTPEKKKIFGKGNFQTLTEKIRAKAGVTAVFVNVERLSPSSEKELQEAWGVKVLDRYSLVLHIFRCNARTKEAKLQISLAEIPLLRSRLRNEVENLDQQGGGSKYIMGSGETLYEVQQRLLKERELKIRSALERLRRKRHLLRSQRKHKDFPIVSIMGYTNCGKTTLIKALTGDAGLQPKDQLFATLDVTVHAGQLPSHMTVLYVDTIGFLSQLPHQLIDSFSATLEDVAHSKSMGTKLSSFVYYRRKKFIEDLIIHVRDISHPETVNQKVNVLNVLKNLQIPEKLFNTIIEVHNKIDLIEGYQTSDPEVISISALKEHGLDVLTEKIEEAVVRSTGKQTMTLVVQLNSPQIAWLYKEATVQAVDDVGDDCMANVKVIISQAAYGRYRKLFRVT